MSTTDIDIVPITDKIIKPSLGDKASTTHVATVNIIVL